MKNLKHITIPKFVCQSGHIQDISISYQLFGLALHTAPIVLVNHALTANSSVVGQNAWWSNLVGNGKCIDLNKFTVLCFNIPGNGYDDFFIENYDLFCTKDIANLFILGLKYLEINQLHSVIGGSIGGAIAWEILVIQPNLAQNFFPIATDYQTKDWLLAHTQIQKHLLESNENPLQKARQHAMLCYRTPQSLNERFKREKIENSEILKSQDWLNYHGEALHKRFSIKAYRLMNQLLASINTPFQALKNITADIHFIAIDTDLFFPCLEMQIAYKKLKKEKKNVFFHQINSVHGHDAFLMEYEQLNQILSPFFIIN